MPYAAVICGATLLFTGAASLVCSGSVVLVPEVLNNIWLASNTFKLCGTTKRSCHYTAAPMYTVLKMNVINKLKLYMAFDLSGGGDAYGVAQEESHS